MTRTDEDAVRAWTVVVGGRSYDELLTELGAAGIYLNAHAETLLAAAARDEGSPRETVSLVQRSAGELGLREGGTVPEIFERAMSRGLRLCPPTTAAYLRLHLRDQASAPDTGSIPGQAPPGSLTVAAPRLRDDDAFPRGFYLRVIDGGRWLRGYRCDDAHVWSPDDRFVFRTDP